MVYGKLQSIIKMFKGLNALELVQYFFVIIPVFILAFLYIFMAQADIAKVFDDPTMVGQLLIVLVMPFCYLIMKGINAQIKDSKQKDGTLIALWIMIFFQLSSFNMICSFLIAYGTFQEFGHSMFKFKKMKLSKEIKPIMFGLIPLGLVYALVLFVKYRVGILF